MTSALGARSTAELRPESTVLLVPIGSCEQHGPHLPLDTDTRIAVAVSMRAAERAGGAVVAPAVAYGSSGEHAGFAGTLSIGQAALETLVVELVRSADAFAAVVLVNGHGGNAEPIGRAVSLLRAEGRSVRSWWPPAVADPAADAHAGWTETSILLVLAPELVAMSRAEPGATQSLAELLPALRRGGVRMVTPNGVLGDPTGASVGAGRRLVATYVDDLVATIAATRGR
jgi:creatinine amidohydrolase